MLRTTLLRAVPARVLARSQSAAAGTAAPPAVGYWLLGTAGMVGGMVAVGGVTRLTRSGLSMTDWRPQGGRPPSTEAEWRAELEVWKQSPEGRQRAGSMTLSEFKTIYFWEWSHRMLGRTVGVVYGAPLVYFGLSGAIPRAMWPRVGLLLGLGGAQGAIGWWMVKSGLEGGAWAQQRLETGHEVRVSPYRLATHLSMAFATYGLLLWTAMDVLRPMAVAVADAKATPLRSLPALQLLRGSALTSTALVAATALSGAFVAGNDAGNAYNTFPKMDGQWVPDGMWALTPFYRNLAETTATVQFDHRVLAMTSVVSVASTAALSLVPAVRSALPALAARCVGASGLLVVGQASLGVATLLNYVPIGLAASHQLGSLALLSVCGVGLHAMRFVPIAARAAAKRQGGLEAIMMREAKKAASKAPL